MKNIFVVVFILIALNVKSQSFKFSLGATNSSLSFDKTVPLFNVPTMSRNYDYKNLKIIGVAFTFGIDYLEKKYFNLSTNIGFLNKGGLASSIFLDSLGNPTGTKLNIKWPMQYFTINSTIDLHYPVSKYFSPFLSIGPRFDYLISPRRFYKLPVDNNRLAFGLNIGLGFKVQMKNYTIGFKYDYMPNFIKILEYNSYGAIVPNKTVVVKDKTSQLNLLIGGALKKRKIKK